MRNLQSVTHFLFPVWQILLNEDHFHTWSPWLLLCPQPQRFRHVVNIHFVVIQRWCGTAARIVQDQMRSVMPETFFSETCSKLYICKHPLVWTCPKILLCSVKSLEPHKLWISGHLPLWKSFSVLIMNKNNHGLKNKINAVYGFWMRSVLKPDSLCAARPKINDKGASKMYAYSILMHCIVQHAQACNTEFSNLAFSWMKLI